MPINSNKKIVNEKLLSTILENIHDIILLVDREGNIRYINHFIPSLQNKSKDIYTNIFDYFTDDTKSEIRKSLDKAFKGDNSITITQKMFFKGLNLGWFEGKFIPIYENGQINEVDRNQSPAKIIKYVLIIGTDITRFKKAEEQSKIEINERILAQNAMREGQIFLQGILSSLSETTIFVCDKSGQINFAWAPKELEERYGIKIKGYMGENIQEIVKLFKEPQKNIFPDIIKIIKKTKKPYRVEHHLQFPKDTAYFDIIVNYLDISGDLDDIFIVTGRDITKLKRLQIELKENEESLHEANRIAKIGSWKWNKDEGVIKISEEFQELFGYCAEDFQNSMDNYINMAIPEDDRKKYREFYNYVIDNKRSSEIEHRFITKDNKILWVYENVRFRLDSNGDIKQINGVIQDITERRRSIEKLKRSEQKYKVLVDNTTDYICQLDLQGNIIFLNEPLKIKLGLDNLKNYYNEEDKFFTLNLLDFVHPNDKKKLILHLLELSKGKNFNNEIFRLKKREINLGNFSNSANEDYFYVSSNCNPLYYEDYNKIYNQSKDQYDFIQSITPYAILCTMHDADPSEKSQILHKKLSDKFKTIFDEVATGIMIIESETKKIIDINQTALDILNFKKDELIGKKCVDKICSTKEEDCEIMRILSQTALEYSNHQQTDKICARRTLRLNSEGLFKPIIVTAKRVKYNNKEYILESFLEYNAEFNENSDNDSKEAK